MKKPKRVPGDSPVDIGDAAVRRYYRNKAATLGDLYDWLKEAGLTDEEADEMCNLVAETETDL